MKQPKNSETQSYSWDVTLQPSPHLPYLAFQRKQDFYENGIIFCTTPQAFLYCREPKRLPSCLCTTQPHELSVHTASTTYRKREPDSLECVRNNSASEQPAEVFCTQAYQSGLHCTPYTHIDRLNGAKLLQETSHILLSCPFVELSYPECGTANYNQELAQVARAITDTSSLQDRQPTLISAHAEFRVGTREGTQGIPLAADYCSNV